jgi:hypothetical protein
MNKHWYLSTFWWISLKSNVCWMKYHQIYYHAVETKNIGDDCCLCKIINYWWISDFPSLMRILNSQLSHWQRTTCQSCLHHEKITCQLSTKIQIIFQNSEYISFYPRILCIFDINWAFTMHRITVFSHFLFNWTIFKSFLKENLHLFKKCQIIFISSHFNKSKILISWVEMI